MAFDRFTLDQMRKDMFSRIVKQYKAAEKINHEALIVVKFIAELEKAANSCFISEDRVYDDDKSFADLESSGWMMLRGPFDLEDRDYRTFDIDYDYAFDGNLTIWLTHQECDPIIDREYKFVIDHNTVKPVDDASKMFLDIPEIEDWVFPDIRENITKFLSTKHTYDVGAEE